MLSAKRVRRVEFVSQLFQLCPHERAAEGVWQALRAANFLAPRHTAAALLHRGVKSQGQQERGTALLIHSRRSHHCQEAKHWC